MGDQAKFILTTSAQYFAATASPDDASIVRDFLDNSELTLLAATLAQGRVRYAFQVATEQTCLLFYKIPKIGATANGGGGADPDVGPLGMLTLDGGLVKSIYDTVVRVYLPQGEKKSEYTPEVEEIIRNLHLTLGSSLGFPQSGIHSVGDEIQFWSQKINESPSKADKEKAREFIGSLTVLNDHIRNLHSTTLPSLLEFLDAVHGALDDLWRLPSKFPQNRMRDLIDVITSVIVSVSVDVLSHENIFYIGSYQVDELLTEMTEHMDAWLRICDSLTRFFWPNNGQHQWLGEPYVPVQATLFVERMNEVRELKLMFQQMMAVLADDGQDSVKRLNRILMALKDMNLFDTSPFGRKRWKKKVFDMEKQLQPIDDHIAAVIRSKLQPHLSNARQIVHLFAKYSAILRRTSVLQMLPAEREQCIMSLRSLLIQMKAALAESNHNDAPSKSIGEQCQWLKIFEHQLLEIEQIRQLVDDQNQLDDLKTSLEAVQKEVTSTLNYHFETWKTDSLAAVNSGELTLHTDRPVLEFERDGRQLMRVTFYPSLVTFCQDIGQLESLGFRIPPELRSTCTHATAFMASARRLQQIAAFHNTIGDRMIVCQRPIMLSNAVELSRMVQSESVTWDDQESVQEFVSRLQVAVNQLSKDNTYLAGQHESIRKIIIRLMHVDLLRQEQVWKDELRRLRDIMTGLETSGYQNLQAFKLHWDHQLYKVLEYQYISGISDINQKMPDIHVELVFRQQELQFRPTIEEIRTIYYEQLRRFLERPLAFRGVSDQSGSLFKQMIDRNSDRFAALYLKSATLFEQLENLQTIWRPWIALGLVNLDELCSVHLTTWEDWDKNFKSCKHFSQQVAKIEATEHRVDCFVISVGQLRSEIEYISRKYWDMLAKSLKVSILKDIDELQMFVQTSLQVLQNVPMDDEGIAEAGVKYENIMTGLPGMKTLLSSVEGKDSCLAGWCKERVSSLSNLITQWDQLQPLIENHSIVLQRQIEIMRSHLESALESIREEAEKFEIRWEATVSDLHGNENYNSTLFRERQQAWATIKDNRTRLENDCTKYNIAFPVDLQDLFEKVDTSVSTESQQWEEYEQFLDEFETIGSEEWTVYRRRPYILTDCISKWSKMAASVNNASGIRIRKVLENYQNVLPVLQTMQSDGLTDRHWDRVFQMLQKSVKPLHEILLKDMLSSASELVANTTEIQSLVRQAASEQVVRQALAELDQWAATAVLNTLTHVDSRMVNQVLCKDIQEILNKIGDNQCLLQSAKNSSSFDAFSDRVTIWEGRLSTLDFLLTNLSQIQRKWIYLEPIFNSGTMRSDESTFKRIDKDFRYIMKGVADDPRLMSIIKINNITSIIELLEVQLGRCQNSLSSYITTKREAFPRFYFLADDDLLEILGQSSKPETIQKHINKLFPGVHRLGLDTIDGVLHILRIESAEGDSIALTKAVPISEAVESWLNDLVAEIKRTLTSLMHQCSRLDTFRLEHIETYPVQVLSTTKAITFTAQTTKCIQSISLAGHLQKLKSEIDLYNSDEFRASNALIQSKIRALLLDLVHYVAIVEQLIKSNVTSPTDWLWLQQMQFFMHPSTHVVSVRMVHAEFEYSYEYLGNSNKLVHTTLTHNCYLTLTQAMHLGLGGNPFGPAGTGKTECVKSLGAMLGRLVLVFNCSENVDADAMKLILSGLARCGAWGCFDEFNRLQEATLSAISMMIQPLQAAIKDQQKSVTIVDDQIPLNLHCGIFVTLNPAGEGYGGRQNLPANLQSLFRPIVMQQPEPGDIARVLLFAERFQHADRIGGQLVEVFQMAQEMLSPQRHYDWGLRELKTVLLACGKMRNSIRGAESIGLSEESAIVVKALRSNTMSKLSRPDRGRFDMLIESIFPNVPWKGESNVELRQRINEAFGVLGLRANDQQVELCLQLYEQLVKRTGVVVLGPPRSGKSTVIAVLKQALTSEHGVIRTYTIAPKSMTRVQLLGHLDPDTRQWQDGVLTSTAIVVNNEPDNVTSWIICDGDVDPEWIEALNSVLDDNKLLTLPSGWRIQFGNNVNFIFETHDLCHASPATISRMGIISLNDDDLHIANIIDTWLLKHNRSSDSRVSLFMETHLQACLDWMRSHDVPFSGPSLVQNCLPFLADSDTKEECAVAMMRAFGGCIPDMAQQRSFCEFILDRADIRIPSQSEPELSFYNEFRRSVECYDLDDSVSEVNGVSDEVPALIRTGHVKMYSDVLRNYLQNQDRLPFLLCGPSGVGKTLLLQHVSSEFSGYQMVTINCSAQLTPNFVLYTLKQHFLSVSGIRGREYRPKFQRVLIFFKNLHLCTPDAWGTSAIGELLMQLIQRNGVYDNDTSEWISVSGCQIAASMAGIGQHGVSPRLMALFRVLCMSYPSESDMQSIFQKQFARACQHYNQSEAQIENFVDALLDIYSQICKSFPISTQVHYVFNPKMITNCIRALAYYPVDQLEAGFTNELIATFRNRLTSREEWTRFDEILAQSSRFAVKSGGHIFAPSSSKSSDMLHILEEEWRDSIQRNLTICGTEDIHLDTPITLDLLRNTSNVNRVLVRPMGNLLICGPLGSGRLAALHLACTGQQIKIVQPAPVAHYSADNFLNDLRMAVQSAALEDVPIVFHVDHVWLTYLPQIMRPIEGILQGSEIPELFGDDLENVVNPLRGAANLSGYQDSLISFFWKRVKSNLHVVLTLESGPHLRELFKQYPSLYRKADVIFTAQPNLIDRDEWSRRALQNIYQLNTISETDAPTSLPGRSVLELAGDWELSPLRLTHLVRTFVWLFRRYSNEHLEQLKKYQAGVDRLSSAHAVVAELKAQAQIQEDAMTEKKELANQALEQITFTMRNANDQRTNLQDLHQKTQASREKLLERKAAIEVQLREVEPILQEATAAVGQIKGEALSEIRSLRAPPEVIRDILEGVLRLMGVRDTSWNSMKSFLAKRGVKEDIRSFDPVRITPENCTAVEALLKAKADSFLEKNAKRASAAAAPLASWVIANVRYSRVIQSIKPLEREQNRLQENLVESEGQMQSLTSGLDDVDTKVKALSEQLNRYTQEAAVLEVKLNDARSTLNAAEVLVHKLSSEYSSWVEHLATLNEDQHQLNTKAFLISYAITHLSHYTFDNRRELLTKMQSNIELHEFDLTENIITAQDQIVWESMGLSADLQSMQNAALLSKMLELPFGASPTPIVLDPTGTALVWLQEFLKLKSISHDMTSQESDRFTYNLELAVRFGKCLIVHDFDSVKPPLMSVLLANILSRFNKKALQVGNKVVDLHDHFRLILVTKSNKMTLTTDAAAYVTCIPFTTTVLGYTGLLMSKTVQLKQPQLELKRIELLQAEGRMLNQRAELRDRLLVDLSTAEGDILRNDVLLSTLTEVKQSSNSIEESLAESSAVRMKLMEEYNQYQELCSGAARFYIGISGIYNVSVEVFTKLFLNSIETQEVNQAFQHLDSTGQLARLTFSRIARSVPTVEHIRLGLQVCKFAFPQKFPDKEWESFITNMASDSDDSHSADHVPTWIHSELVAKVSALRSRHPDMYQQLNLDNQSTWNSFARAKQYTDVPASIGDFQKILVTQCVRPDILLDAVSRIVCKLLSIKSMSIARPSIKQMAEETESMSPILLIATGDDADPSKGIQELVATTIGRDKYVELSLGKGQESQAISAIERACEQGSWVCLKNLQLVREWLPSLNQKLDAIVKCSPSFRLWLISDSMQSFPETLLQKCNTLLYESPSGVKNKVLALIQKYQPRLTQIKDAKRMKLRVIVFVLNAVLQERRRYVPEGWSRWYEFGDSDLETALTMADWLDAGGSRASKLDWSVLRGLCQHLAYGGRICNQQDVGILVTHLEAFLNDQAVGSDRWRPLQLQQLRIPQSSNVHEYMSAFSELGDVETPEMICMAAATNVTRDLVETRELLKQLRYNYFSKSGTESSLEKRFKPMLGLWKKLLTDSDLLTLSRHQYDQSDASSESPWQSFVRSEMQTSATLIRGIHETLMNLYVAIKELDTMSPEDLALVRQIADNQTPLQWRQLWPNGPKGLTDFLRVVVHRSRAAAYRYKEVHGQGVGASSGFASNATIPLCEVLNANAFLAALKMCNASELMKSACDLVLSSSFTDRSSAGPKSKPNVSSLRIVGASFRDNRIVTSTVGSADDGKLPDFQIFFTDRLDSALSRCVPLPVYTNSRRDQLLCTLTLESVQDAQSFVLAGAALYVSEIN